MTETGLVRYDAMCRAIAACIRVDEVTEIRRQAVALEHYARMAKNKEAVRQCGQIRLRAERKAGELLIALKAAGKMAKGGAPYHKHTGSIVEPVGAGVLADLQITKRQSHDWQQLAALPRGQVEAALENVAVPTINALLKKPRRDQREADLAAKTIAASRKLGKKRYGVVYADPPWRFEPYSRDTGMDRAADNHYPTMTLSDIKAMAVPAADDCVLFLWATAPMLPEALAVMAAWGFTYKSHCVWTKDRVGTGYWFRNQHELLLVGTKGNIPAPTPGTQYASVIGSRVGPHSRKPEAFAEMVDELFPNLPGVELFARAPREGWDVIGNEVE